MRRFIPTRAPVNRYAFSASCTSASTPASAASSFCGARHVRPPHPMACFTIWQLSVVAARGYQAEEGWFQPHRAHPRRDALR